MKASGFDYFPVECPEELPFVEGDPVQFVDPYSGVSIGESEYIENYGIGLTAEYRAGIARGSTIREIEPDQNDSYRNSLSESDRRAYDEAFLGQGTADDLGCVGEADLALSGVQVDREAEETARRSYADAEEAVLNSIEVAAALDSWRECMAVAGFNYSDPDQGFADLASRFESMLGKAAIEQRSLEESELAEFESLEKSFAISNLGCGGGEEGLGKLFQELLQARLNADE